MYAAYYTSTGPTTGPTYCIFCLHELGTTDYCAGCQAAKEERKLVGWVEVMGTATGEDYLPKAKQFITGADTSGATYELVPLHNPTDGPRNRKERRKAEALERKKKCK